MFRIAGFRIRLPNVTDLFWRLHHWLLNLAGEGGSKLRRIHDAAVDAVLAGGMWIGYRIHPLILGTVIFAGPPAVVISVSVLSILNIPFHYLTDAHSS